MIEASFEQATHKSAAIGGIYQYDTGQRLRMHGLPTPEELAEMDDFLVGDAVTVQAQYGYIGDSQTETRLAAFDAQTGCWEAEIPDAYLTRSSAVKVFVYDMAQEGGAYTCGDNFTAKLIEYAGGENIFRDLNTTWSNVSWEEVVERAPEVIVINDYGSTSLEQKIAELKENPALATVPAIENDRILSVTLCEVFACSMTGDTIEKFARAFHPDCF